MNGTHTACRVASRFAHASALSSTRPGTGLDSISPRTPVMKLEPKP